MNKTWDIRLDALWNRMAHALEQWSFVESVLNKSRDRSCTQKQSSHKISLHKSIFEWFIKYFLIVAM